MADLGSIAGELYALDLDAFTAERNRRARELRTTDRALSDAVGALPKPSAAAWLVDQLVREEGEVVAAALALGPGLRAAQAALDRDALRELGAERRRALGAVADAARRVAERRGRPLSSSVADEVEQTVVAAIADADAEAAVRSGRLVRTLVSIGADPVDLDGAVAAPGEALAERGAAAVPRRPVRAAPRPDPAAAARAELERARQAEREAETALEAADDALTAAVERHGELVEERDAALAEYERLERAVGDAERARREAIRERDRAARRAEGAARVVGRAEGKLGGS
ncbi:MAG TPA: hypothetical protein VNR36_07520 [Pseudolysinimonas sp.]|nr:hypothetical protein [Pseudolysinimonas sp.]